MSTPSELLQVLVLDRVRAATPGRAAITRLLRSAGRCVGAPAGEVAVVLTRDAEVRGLNRRFRGKDRATDVLAFPDGRGPVEETRRIGDIVISVPVARRQAGQAGHSLDEEVRRLLIHGFLHLLGYDHEVDGGEMAELEAHLARRLIGRRSRTRSRRVNGAAPRRP